MLVFWEQRLVFLATPKTGSTAIEAALEGLASLAVMRPDALKHSTAAAYRRHLGPYLAELTGARFTVVALMREPLDWLGSWYRSRRMEEPDEAGVSTRDVSFEQFVRDYTTAPRPAHADVGSQAAFLCEDGRLAVDRLFPYERIDDFVRFLEDRLDCEILLPQLKVSPKAALDVGPATLARLKAAAAADFDLHAALADGR